MPMPNYMNQYQFPFAGNQMPIQQPQVPVQSQQTTGLVPVPSEEVARNYPVGFGQSVSFKDENLPFIYTKTMGFSQLEPPKFEKYRLIKEGSSDETKSDGKDRKETANMVSELKKEMDDQIRPSIFFLDYIQGNIFYLSSPRRTPIRSSSPV